MHEESKYPVLEFDSTRSAKLEPSSYAKHKLSANKLIITYFPEVMDKLIAREQIHIEARIRGENPIIVYKFSDADSLILLGPVGCPACGRVLEIVHAMGVDKVMFCGGGGVLDRDIEVGQLFVVDGAIRDEGFSYHYIEPSRYIYANPAVTEKIVRYLESREISYLRGLTWTTDAIFRETADTIILRKKEGAKIVEMEQAACIAVSQFRGFDYGALLYGGDDLSQSEWSKREWMSREGIRYDLVCLCKDLLDIL